MTRITSAAMTAGLVMFVVAIAATFGWAVANAVNEAGKREPQTVSPRSIKPINNKPKGTEQKMAKATFGAGCFWGVEAAFRQVEGVTGTAVGYLGGTLKNPTYEDVCTGRTGHAEVVQVEYDPAKVSYEKLLSVFWENHNPTQLNRQGPDTGTQYRSAVFYHDEAQKAAAEASKAEMERSGHYNKPIVTEITPASQFYRAEEYHQQYLEKRGLASCHI
jgi:peptide-methionine (S)-S-oxide reductase